MVQNSSKVLSRDNAMDGGGEARACLLNSGNVESDGRYAERDEGTGGSESGEGPYGVAMWRSYLYPVPVMYRL